MEKYLEIIKYDIRRFICNYLQEGALDGLQGNSDVDAYMADIYPYLCTLYLIRRNYPQDAIEEFVRLYEDTLIKETRQLKQVLGYYFMDLDEVSQLKEQNESLKALNSSLTDKVTESDSRIAGLISKISKLTAEKRLLTAENEELQRKISEITKESTVTANSELRVSSLLERGEEHEDSAKMARSISSFQILSDVLNSMKMKKHIERIPAEDLSAEVSADNALGIKLVDMGTSVLWADRNLGSSDPLKAGDYYCWGQLEEYWGRKQAIPEIDDIKGDPKYDVVCKMLGRGWSIPSYKDWYELMIACNVTRSESGFIVRSRKTGKTLIFPYSFIYTSDGFSGHSETSLWTSKTYNKYNNTVYKSHIVRFEKQMTFDVREIGVGLNIRPVYTPSKSKTQSSR